jgi:hypothetical protein
LGASRLFNNLKTTFLNNHQSKSLQCSLQAHEKFILSWFHSNEKHLQLYTQSTASSALAGYWVAVIRRALDAGTYQDEEQNNDRLDDISSNDNYQA